MTQHEVRIPDIGDAEDVEVIEILAKTGAVVAVDDPLIVIESDKASMEVPSTAAGTIGKVSVSVGDKVKEGQIIAVIDGPDDTESKSATEPSETTTKTSQPAAANDPSSPERNPREPESAAPAAPRRLEVRVPDIGDAEDVVVVEVSVSEGQQVEADDLLMVVESDKASMEIPAPAAGRIVSIDVAPGTNVNEGTLLVVIETIAKDATPARAAAAQTTDADGAGKPAAESPAATAARNQSAPTSHRESGDATGGSIYAGPAVRRLARELGVDLKRVQGSGSRGRILNTDVQTHVKAALARAPSAGGSALPAMPAVDFSKFGPIETVSLSRIRLRGAENLHRSWLNVVHVTQHDDADITDLEIFRRELKAEPAATGVKVTPLAFVIRAVVATLQTHPNFNASLDAEVKQLILKRYINIGIAVDTADGLVVPVLHDADRMGIVELARQIAQLSEKAQQGKLAINELQGSSFTISSLGAIGGLGFTPIVNSPEVAILGVSRLTVRPQWNGTSFEPRQMLPLSLSYDHRAINGAEAGRFLTSLCQTLKDMRRVLL